MPAALSGDMTDASPRKPTHCHRPACKARRLINTGEASESPPQENLRAANPAIAKGFNSTERMKPYRKSAISPITVNTPQTQANGAHRRGLPSPTRKDYGSEAADDIFVAACHVCWLLRIYSTACSIAPARSHLKCQHTSFVSSVSPSSRISSKSP